ncbi:MAG: osmotically-inducible protein OsmY [Alphaproteobacteria bacterium]|jgi:osmotically-inducible protein OsmY
MHKVFLALIMSSSLLLSGCLPLLLGGAATAGYLGTQERSAKAALSDINIKTLIKDRLTGQYYKYLTQVEVSVLQGNVLLTGVVKSLKTASEVESLVRSIEGVKDVYNELFMDGIYPTTTYSSDAWVATQLKSYMFADKAIHATNYQVLAVNGHAYIFGLAENMAEREAVRHLARTTKGVVQVHSFINLYKAELPFKNSLFTMPWVDSEDDIEE